MLAEVCLSLQKELQGCQRGVQMGEAERDEREREREQEADSINRNISIDSTSTNSSASSNLNKKDRTKSTISRRWRDFVLNSPEVSERSEVKRSEAKRALIEEDEKYTSHY